MNFILPTNFCYR